MALASAIMARARRIIQDEKSVRWPLPELCDWLNDGLREIRIHKPALFSKTITIALMEGTRQQLPANCEHISRIIGNARTENSDRRARLSNVTVVDQGLMAISKPDWHDERHKRQQVKHVIFDESDPRSFYVYPANDGTGHLTVVGVQPHQNIAPTGTPTALASYDVNVPIDDVYANALVDYCLYRLYAKDAQFSANAERAVLYYTQFSRGIGLKITQDANTSLNVRAGTPRSAAGVSSNA